MNMQTATYKSRIAFIPSTPLLPGAKRLCRQIQAREYSKKYIKATLRVELLTIGRRNSKDTVYDKPINELQKRMTQTMCITERIIQRDKASTAVQAAQERGSVILLDEKGLLPKNSLDFALIIFNALEQGGSRLSFVIGDADGLPSQVSSMTSLPRVQALSLSTLTLTHKMVRLFLHEQLYRATQIRAGTKYHR